MHLSLVIPSHNETDIVNTFTSAMQTAPEPIEVIVVDDASNIPVPNGAGIQVIRTEHRIGVGGARHLGVLKATGDAVLFTDSHCRFAPGWYEILTGQLTASPRTLFCASCLALDPVAMDVTRPKGTYFGATWNFFGPDRKKPFRHQFFEAIWAPEQAGDDYVIPAVMGACYAMNRDWFLELNPLRFLRSWGGDEQALSLKAWLSGGEARLLKQVKIGHRFHEKGPTKFPMKAWQSLYNKLFLIHTCLPEAHQKVLLAKIPHGSDFRVARQNIEADWAQIEIEREANRRLFQRDFSWLLEQFGLSFPKM